jgi:uncharacterized protein YggU (UPF0235/DUF167 family)
MIVRLKVHTKAKKEVIKKLKESDRYEVWIKEPARNNIANTKLKELVANMTGFPIEEVRLIKGGKSSFKTFAIKSN